MLTVGHEFPEFSLKIVDVDDDGKKPFETLDGLPAMWTVLFTWPADFTFVCPTEIRAFNDLHEELTNRGVALVGMSTDGPHAHVSWRRNDLPNVTYPWLSDQCGRLSEELGILDADLVCQRATFIVDDVGIIRYVSVHDINVGRNAQEILRVVDALMTGEKTPANWQPGQETLG